MSRSPRVVSLHRYPIKSMLGEEVTHLDVDERGCVGDRLWTLRTSGDRIASGKNSSRFAALPRVLELRAEKRNGTVVITFPDGSTCTTGAPDASDRLSSYLEEPVTLAMESDVSHFDDGPISLIGLASVSAVAQEQGEDVDPARFRANIVLDTSGPFLEDRWVGRELQVGTAVLSVIMSSPRCVMVDMKTANLPAQPGNLSTLGRINRAHLGVIARVLEAGTIRAGDSVEIR